MQSSKRVMQYADVDDNFSGYKKLNQLINIDRTNLTTIMVEMMDKLLSLPQRIIYNNKEHGVTLDVILNTKYSMPAELFLGNRDRSKFPFIYEQMKSISDLKIKCIDKKYNCGIINIIQGIVYNSEEDSFEYKINNDITMSYYNSNNIIGEPESKPYFTDVSKKFEIKNIDYKSNPANHLYEYCLQYDNLAQKMGGTYKFKVSLNEFKSMIGVKQESYSKLSDLRNKVIIPAIKKLKDIYDYNVEIEIMGIKNSPNKKREKSVNITIMSKKRKMELDLIKKEYGY